MAVSTLANEVNEGRHLLLADRGDRLSAVLVDWMLPVFPLSIGLSGVHGFWPAASTEWIGFSALGAWILFQCVLLSTRGQTVGKWLYGVRVVDAADGSAVGFVRVALLRALVPLVVVFGVQAAGWTGIGQLAFLVDVLWIFTRDRRCLHDRLARTRVVRCPQTSRRRASVGTRGRHASLRSLR